MIISIDQKLMCPVQFQSLLVYSEMNLKWNGDIASPCCRLFWRGNISDMFAFLDSIVCFFEHVLIDVTNFVDMPCWMRMYKIFHSNRLMFCYIAFAFSLLVLMNAEYVISMWSIMLKITPIAIFFFGGGGQVCLKCTANIHCICQIKYDAWMYCRLV